jgi:para-nitrobenzyl esterase
LGSLRRASDGSSPLRATRARRTLAGTKLASAFGPSCPQTIIPGVGPASISEDCLTLSVFAVFIAGTNRDEWRLFQTLGLATAKTAADFEAQVTATYPDDALVIIEHYRPASDAEANAALIRLHTDSYFRCPTRALVRSAAAQSSRAWLYSFDVPPAAHALEVDYVFGFNSVGLLFPNEAPNPPIPSVTKAMQGYWSTFAAAGDPNGGGQPAWPAYDRASDRHLSLAAEISTGSGLSSADCDFWDQIAARAH